MPSPTDTYSFPGRWLAGTALILGPALLLTGVLLRLRFHFFFPQQLAAYDQHPTLMTISYSAFAAGSVIMCPAVAALARLIGATRPDWAALGGILAMIGLFARTFHAGIDHLAFQLVDVQDRPSATRAVAGSYQGFHIFHYVSFAIILGWIVLAIGAYRSRTLGLPRSLALAFMAALPLGVLKGTTPLSILATAGLCAALMPLGLKTLRNGPRPTRRSLGRFAALTTLVIVLGYVSTLG
jgi:hypothetical protein